MSTPPDGSSGSGDRATAIAPTLTLEPWVDELIERHGHDPRSLYAELFYLPTLGPSTTWLLRRFAAGFDEQPGGFTVDCAELATELGLGPGLRRNSPFVKSVDRLVTFNMAQFHRDTLYVRRKLPPLSPGQASRLPTRLARLHASWGRSDGGDGDVDGAIDRARRLAMTLLELGESSAAAEHQLHTWRFHPSIAWNATQWALERHQRAHAALTDDADHPALADDAA